MKIILLTSFANPSTGASTIWRLRKDMIDHGNEMSVITTDPDCPDEKNIYKIENSFIDKLINIFIKLTIENIFPYGYRANHRKIVRIIKKINPDIISVHWIHGHTIPLSVVRKISKKYRVFWTFHDMWPMTGEKTYETDGNGWKNGYNTAGKSSKVRKVWRTKKKFLENTNIEIICPSKWMAKKASESSIFSGHRILNIPNGIDTDFYSPVNKEEKENIRDKLNIPLDHNVLLFVSSTLDDKRKGYEYLKKSIDILREKISLDKTTVILVGKEKEKIDNISINHIKTGSVSDQNTMREYYRASDIFILPTEADNLPSTCIESISCGVPVIAFSVGGVSDIVDNNQNGILIEANSVNRLAESIQKLLNDQSLREIFSKNSREKSIRTFSQNIQTGKYLDEFKKVKKCDICRKSVYPLYKNLFDDRFGYPKLFDIEICTNCKSLITLPPLTQDEIGPLYTNFYPRKDISPEKVSQRARAWKSESSFMRWLTGEHRVHRYLPKITEGGIRVLDVGCGDGSSLIELKSLGYEAYGIETDTNLEKIKNNLGLNIHIGTIENCPFPPESFDYVIANQVIEHVIDLDSFIKNSSKFLKKGGKLITSTPNSRSIFIKIYRRKWMHWHIPYHQHILSKKAHEILLERQDLKINKIFTVSPSSWSMHEINRLRFDAKPGLKNPFWTNDTAIKSGMTGKVGRKILFIIMSITGKIADMFGRGNCIITYSEK